MKKPNHIKTFVLLLAFFSFLVIVPVQVHADDAETLSQGSVLRPSKEEGILMLLKRNLDIAAQQIEPQVKTAKVEGEEGIFGPGISGYFTAEDSTTPLSSRLFHSFIESSLFG